MSKRISKKRRKRRKKTIIFLLLVLAIFGGLYYFGIIGKEDIPVLKKEKKLKILDLDSRTRPYAVMIDNVGDAKPQSGLDKAYLTYEIVVEGGLTRLMAVFKDVDVSEIGPVRSARHYFIDYALENDAIFVHHGRSPQALKRISEYDVDDLEGLYNPSNMFWRDNNRYAPHNSYTSTSGIKKAISDKEIEKNSDDWLLLNYSVKEIDLSKKENAKKADKIIINFSNSSYTTLEYDKDKKVYNRSENGKPHMDKNGTQYTTKNIIIVTGVKNYTIDYKTGRQDITNVGTGEGYFITNGYATLIEWEKNDIDTKTRYTYKNGKEIKVNDGNTYIEIQPLGQSLNITALEQSSASSK